MRHAVSLYSWFWQPPCRYRREYRGWEGRAEGIAANLLQEDFELVFGELHRRAAEIENQTGAQIRIAVTKEIPPIVNDAGMVRKGMAAGRAVFAERFMLGTEPFLVGDNAAYYLQQVPGMRVVFLAGKP